VVSRRWRSFVELLRGFRVTLVVFVALVVGMFFQRDAVIAWLAGGAGFGEVHGADSLPAAYWLRVALRLAVLPAAVPFAAEGWIVLCRWRRAPGQTRLWPLLCLATLLVLAADLELTRHFARELTTDYLYCFSAARSASIP
jgi:hypothetical protein